MSKTEYVSFGQKLAFHTAPTLLGIKCASLISLSTSEFDLDSHVRCFNARTAGTGLKIRILCACEHRTLVLIYNEKLLCARLTEPAAKKILRPLGYDTESTADNMLGKLSARISESGEFPHEIGIFLGYPIEDVRGFIENKGENYKLCGCWKVYGSEESARRTFENYEKCRKFLCDKLNEGCDIYRALRIS